MEGIFCSTFWRGIEVAVKKLGEDDAKSDHVKQLLKETEKYLQKLCSKLQEAKTAASRFEHDIDEAQCGSFLDKSESSVENEDKSDQAKAIKSCWTCCYFKRSSNFYSFQGQELLVKQLLKLGTIEVEREANQPRWVLGYFHHSRVVNLAKIGDPSDVSASETVTKKRKQNCHEKNVTELPQGNPDGTAVRKAQTELPQEWPTAENTSRGAKSTQPPSGATYPRVHPETPPETRHFILVARQTRAGAEPRTICSTRRFRVRRRIAQRPTVVPSPATKLSISSVVRETPTPSSTVRES
ncbi:Chromatin structure-remodeling complex protein SYD [Arachis hypogaea]|nr:Chromatin structure-remodeling complex protein SYD [Arachis hypogaea]